MSDAQPDDLPPEPTGSEHPEHHSDHPISASDLPEPFADPPEMPLPEEAVAEPVTGLAKFKPYLQMTGVFMACMYVVATTSLLLTRPAQQQQQQVHTTTTNKPTTEKTESILGPRLEDVDARLKSGDYGEALRGYEQMAAAELGKASSKLLYRIGLCKEALGEYEEANGYFRDLAETDDTALVRWVSRISQARSWLRHGQFARARNLLGGLILEGTDAFEKGHPVGAETYYLFAMASQHLEKPKATDPGEPVLARPPMTWPVENVIGWLDGEKIAPAAAGPKVLPRRKPNERENEISALPIAKLIEIPEKEYSASELFELIAKTAEYQLEINEEFKASLADRKLNVKAPGMTISAWLTALAWAVDTRWTVSDGKLQVENQLKPSKNPESMNTEVFADDTSVTAELSLRMALERSPNHRLAQTARLQVGNMYYVRKQYGHALLEFQDLVKATVSTIGLAATYNVGLTYQKMGRFESSRAALYRVMDGNPEHPMAAVAGYLIGRMYLDEGSHAEAVGPLEFAARSKIPDESRAPSAVYAAIAHMLADNYHEAGAILFTCQRTFQKSESMRDAAAFLNSYARFLSLGRNSELQRREAVYLFRALFALGSDATWLGPYGMLLVGRAYRDLGLKAQMVRVFERSLSEGATGITASEMRYLQLEARLDREETKASAREDLVRFSNAEFENKWGQRARMRIAKFHFDENRFDECIQVCRDLTNATHIESFELLRLMGHAYESLKQHRNAALCFAGQVPPQS